jgi:dihydrofolate synthase/folylpolyglutamate synthase
VQRNQHVFVAAIGRPLSPTVVDDGFGIVRVPGRLEVVGRRPLLLVDGAHNVAGMQALGLALAEEFDVEGERVAVVGMLSGRDPSAMLAALAPSGVKTVVACEPESPRALPASDLADAGRALGLTVHVEPSISNALERARGLVDVSGLIVITGSMYTVGAAREEILAGAVRWEDAGR